MPENVIKKCSIFDDFRFKNETYISLLHGCTLVGIHVSKLNTIAIYPAIMNQSTLFLSRFGLVIINLGVTDNNDKYPPIEIVQYIMHS